MRVSGLQNVEKPQNVGDVWQFNAAKNWIQEDIPMLSEPSFKLIELVTKSLKNKKTKEHASSEENISR